MNSTILVDWTLFHSNPYTQDFVRSREGQARMVLLVTNPTSDDYDFHSTEQQLKYPSVPEIEWDAVIRNSGELENVIFKATALSVIQDASTMEPVIGLDADHTVNAMYREGGVLITVDNLGTQF